MKKHINHAFLFCLVLLIVGNSNNIITSSSDYLANENSRKYIVQTPFYQIYELGLQCYRYRIGTKYKTFVDDVKHGTDPQIEDISGDIVRLFLGYGTNAFSVQYFDVLGEDKTSPVFHPCTLYADYADDLKEEYLIAYFDAASFDRKELTITDIFGEQRFKTIIERDFVSQTCNRMVFLNENEIYLDYNVLIDNQLSNVCEVVKFR